MMDLLKNLVKKYFEAADSVPIKKEPLVLVTTIKVWIV